MSGSNRRPLHLLLVGIVLAACGGFLLPVDVTVSQWLRAGNLPGELRKLVTISEAFAHGLGVAMILLAIYLTAENHRRQLARVAATAYGAGMMANLVKLLVERKRPYAFDFSLPIGESFGSLFHFSGDRAVQSFPSAHAATGVGFAIGLSMAFPGGRWLFGMAAVLACIQRVQAGAHFPSDVFVGAALGFLADAICRSSHGIGPVFDRLEQPAEVSEA